MNNEKKECNDLNKDYKEIQHHIKNIGAENFWKEMNRKNSGLWNRMLDNRQKLIKYDCKEEQYEDFYKILMKNW